MADRFHIPDLPTRASGDRAILSPEESRHLLKVMRAKAGDQIEVFGGGVAFLATLLESPLGQRKRGDDPAVVELGPPLPVPPLPRVEAWFALPWIKSGRTDEVARHLAELGAAGIIAYAARRAVARDDGGKLARLKKVATEGAKQCGRAEVPQVAEAPSLAAALTLPIHSTNHDATAPSPTPRNLILAERSEGQAPLLSEAIRHILSLPSPSHLPHRLRLIIATGPEGGFHPDELAEAAPHATLASLGPRILRAETAPLAAAAVIQVLSGAM